MTQKPMTIDTVLTYARTLNDMTLDTLVMALTSLQRSRLEDRIDRFPATTPEEDQMIINLRTVDAIKHYKERARVNLNTAHLVITHRRRKLVDAIDRTLFKTTKETNHV